MPEVAFASVVVEGGGGTRTKGSMSAAVHDGEHVGCAAKEEWNAPESAGRPDRFVIRSRRPEPPCKIFFSRFSLRRRACRWAGDSSEGVVEGSMAMDFDVGR